ncbi:von Willebrand factor D and EGF domain-containing protein-like [Ruditapes philippinarum]|uniref:von Willebrand factor D and EGF domain-containing protein-like n=1 Tax=Ruditapes philippinarum TaxID=129788 RepID=UPI00295C32E2|nr:von Willebrand factor D and EGF domain-containing protein-like [Ruditapes philippinarum]
MPVKSTTLDGQFEVLRVHQIFYLSFNACLRLKDGENLFKNHIKNLTQWHGGLPPICRHSGSITEDICVNKTNEHGRRKRRAIDGKTLKVKRNQLDITRDLDNRKKRETFINITEDDATEICKTAIYSSPAVVEFPDKLANENLTVVIGQCVYDVVQENDASWAGAHVAALNNIARNILAFNPVFTTNHSDAVETFLSHTCVNNCSGHGVCLKDGLCSCTGMYKGHDCGVDIRIPPLIFDVQDGGYCDDTNLCTCLVLKSDNLFDGFKCHMKTIKVNFNGSYDVIGNSTEGGRYEDLYTGHCCTMSARQKRSDTTVNDIQPFIYGYDLSISNDGIHFGKVSSVYFYDDTCVYTEDTSESVLMRIKEGFCFVNDTCIKQGFKQTSVDDESYCAVCKPEQNKFSLTFGKCNQEEDGQIPVAAVIGIVIGSLIVLVVILLVVRYIYLKSSKRIRINTEINNRNRTEDISGPGLPDITMFDAAKPRLKTTGILKPMEDAFTKDEMKARLYLNELVSPNEDDEIQPPRCDDIKYERGLSAVSLKIV